MSQIKDNIVVGSIIKAVMQERNISLDDLALHLRMSKRSLKDVIDGKNVINQAHIEELAKYLDVSYESLVYYDDELRCESSFSKYQKIGLDKLGDTIDSTSLSKIDIHGRFLVEYFILENDVEGFKYLVENKPQAFDNLYLDTTVYANVICFMLENKIDALNHIKKYVLSKPGFYIDDEEIKKRIFTSLDALNDEEIFEYLFNGKELIYNRLWKLKFKKNISPLSRREIIFLIGEYKLPNLLKYFVERINDFSFCFYAFIQNNYLEGVKFLLENYPNQEFLKTMNLHEYYLMASKVHDLPIIKYLLDNKYSMNIQTLMIAMLRDEFKEGYDYLLDNYASEFYYREIVCVVSELGNLYFLKRIRKYLDEDELNLALGLAKESDMEYMQYLINENAQFVPDYYNDAYCTKMNNLSKSYKEMK